MLKIATFQHRIAPPMIREHLVLNAVRFPAYQQLKDEVERVVAAETAAGGDAMVVGALVDSLAQGKPFVVDLAAPHQRAVAADTLLSQLRMSLETARESVLESLKTSDPATAGKGPVPLTAAEQQQNSTVAAIKARQPRRPVRCNLKRVRLTRSFE